jgi:hypothetical protein
MQTNANAERDLDTLTALNLDFFPSARQLVRGVSEIG